MLSKIRATTPFCLRELLPISSLATAKIAQNKGLASKSSMINTKK